MGNTVRLVDDFEYLTPAEEMRAQQRRTDDLSVIDEPGYD